MTDVVTGTLAGIALFCFGLGIVFLGRGSAIGAVVSFACAVGFAVLRGQGGPRVRKCPECGNRSTERARFCPNCGHDFSV